MSLGDVLSGLGGLGGSVGDALFPGSSDPTLASLATPQQNSAARNSALMQLGLGIMQAPYSMDGIGGGLSRALTGATQDYQGAMDNAYKHTLLAREADYQQKERANSLTQQDLQIKGQQRTEQEQAAQTAQRVLTGFGAAPDKGAYMSLVQNSPEFKNAITQLGIQAPQSAADMPDFISKLSAAAGVSAPAQAPIKLGPGDTLRSGSDPSQVLASSPGEVTYADAGDRLIPHDKFTGQVRTDLPPIMKNLTPDQKAGVFGDKQKDLLASLASQGVSLPAGMRSRQQIAATLDGLLQKFPDMQPDDIAKQIGAGQIDFAGNKGAAVKLKAQASASTAYAQNIEKTFNNLDPLISQVDATGVPVLNKAFLAIKNKTAPSADSAEAYTYIQTLAAEYGKLRSGSVGNAPLSDAQLREASQVLANAYSKEGYAGLRKAITNEAQNKTSSYNDQLAKLSGSPAVTATPPAVPPAANAGKIASKSDVQAYATKHNMSYVDAVAWARKNGIAVQE